MEFSNGNEGLSIEINADDSSESSDSGITKDDFSYGYV